MRGNLRLTSLLLWTIAASAQAPVAYSIAGAVVDHRSQMPIPSVLVVIEPVSAGQNIRAKALTLITDQAGRFLFSNLAPGKYAITAQRRGGRAQQFKAHGQFSTAIAVGPRLDSEHIVFPLVADARLSGTVTDDEGESVSDATVFLLSKQVLDGKSGINLRGQQQTNGSGAFHFGHLRPGTYYLAVSARPWYAAQASSWMPRQV